MARKPHASEAHPWLFPNPGHTPEAPAPGSGPERAAKAKPPASRGGRRVGRRKASSAEATTGAIDEPVHDAAEETLRAKVWMVHERLCAEYRCPIPYFHSLDPLSELVSSMLSHRTRNRDSGVAYKTLRAALPTWQDVIDAPTERVRELIASVTWPELKAPRIQAVLAKVKERRGELSLDFLGTMDAAEALGWLRTLPGVGPKTAAAVLSFSTLRMAALPVDSHHHRVATRLGLIPPGTSLEAAHERLRALLPPNLTAQEVYDDHEVLMIHGQRCCYHTAPDCERCVLAALCPSCRVPVTPT